MARHTAVLLVARLCPCAQSAGSLLQRWVVQRAVRPEGAVYERTLLSNGRPFISSQVLTEISSARNRPDKADYSFDGFGTYAYCSTRRSTYLAAPSTVRNRALLFSVSRCQVDLLS